MGINNNVPNVKSTFESINFTWDENKSNIENIYDFAIIFLELTDPHDKLATRILEHTMRTIKIAEKIMNKEIADREIVVISILLHDIGKTLCDNSHNLVSFRLAELLLGKYNYDENKKTKILNCILYHSAKDVKTLDLTSEQKVVMDADIIDEIGILLIARICLRTPNKNSSIHEILKSLETKYNKIDKESTLLKTKCGNDIYCQKKKKYREYIDQLKIETAEFKIK